MFIAFQVFAILGIFAGALIFFYGIALFNSYIHSAKSLLSNANDGENTKTENVSGENEEVDLDEKKLNSADFDDALSVEQRKKLFTPLPYFLAIEGVILFVFNALMFILKFYFPKMMEFYVLLPINVGYILLSIVVDAVLMSGKCSDNRETKVENTIDKNE